MNKRRLFECMALFSIVTCVVLGACSGSPALSISSPAGVIGASGEQAVELLSDEFGAQAMKVGYAYGEASLNATGSHGDSQLSVSLVIPSDTKTDSLDAFKELWDADPSQRGLTYQIPDSTDASMWPVRLDEIQEEFGLGDSMGDKIVQDCASRFGKCKIGGKDGVWKISIFGGGTNQAFIEMYSLEKYGESYDEIASKQGLQDAGTGGDSESDAAQASDASKNVVGYTPAGAPIYEDPSGETERKALELADQMGDVDVSKTSYWGMKSGQIARSLAHDEDTMTYIGKYQSSYDLLLAILGGKTYLIIMDDDNGVYEALDGVTLEEVPESEFPWDRIS